MNGDGAIGGQGNPPVNIDLTGYTETQYEDLATKIATGSSLSKDQIVSELKTVNVLTQKVLDNLLAGNPALYEPDPVADATFEKVTGNPWFTPNALITFNVEFFEMLALMQEDKISEKKADVAAMEWIMSLAETSADLILSSAQKEAVMKFAQAAMAAVQGVSSGVALAKTAGAQNAAKAKYKENLQEMEGDLAKESNKLMKMKADNKAGVKKDGLEPPTKADIEAQEKKVNELSAKVKSYKQNEYGERANMEQQMMQTTRLAKEMVDSLFQSVEKIVEAYETISKSNDDAFKEIVSGYQQIARKSMDSAAEGFKSSDDMINQLLQTLKKMTDELFRAFGFRKET